MYIVYYKIYSYFLWQYVVLVMTNMVLQLYGGSGPSFHLLRPSLLICRGVFVDLY